jgi:hypothetical protein
MSIENLLSTKPLLNLPIVNRCTPFGVISYEMMGSRRYMGYNLEDKKIVISKDVVFDECKSMS